jgi:C-terminal processing protease CtpA/Prc
MIKNYLTITLLAFISAFSINEISAQKKEVKKKVIVIEKTVDNDGKIISKKVVKEGAEADAYIKELNKEGEVEINIDAIQEGDHVIKKQAYKVIRIDNDGNEKTTEWNGEGEMPAEIKEMFSREGITLDSSTPHSTFMLKKESSSNNEEIELTLTEGEMSDEVIKALEEENIKVKVISAPNKAELGVMIKDNENGEVEIIDVVEKSAAAEAGLLEGDVIRKVNDIKIDDFDKLLEVLSNYAPNDKLRIGITRDGKKTYKDVALKGTKNTLEFNAFDKDAVPHIKEVEKDVEIIIEKKN